MTRQDNLQNALESMWSQFASRINNKGRRTMTSGGLSALEEAFEVLGYDDPHYPTGGGCDEEGCELWAEPNIRNKHGESLCNEHSIARNLRGGA